jgi:hypothetical protein
MTSNLFILILRKLQSCLCGRPLWREVGSVICQSVLCPCHYMYIYTVYVQNITEIVLNIQYVQGLCQSRLSTADYALLLVVFATTAVLRHLKSFMLDYEWLSLSLRLILRPTVSRRPVCFGIKHSSGAYNQIFITVRLLWVCWCGAVSLTGEGACHLQLLPVLASAVIFGSESRGTRAHILLSQIRDFPFRRLLRLAGLRWRYSNAPPHGIEAFETRNPNTV